MSRVVVTGMGAVTPVGNTVQEFWDALKSGKNGIAPITYFDTADSKCTLAAEIKGFDPLCCMDKATVNRTDPFVRYALWACMQAVEMSGIEEAVSKEQLGVYFGSGIGGFQTVCKEHAVMLEKGGRRVSPLFIQKMISNMAAGTVAIRFGAKGPAISVSTACATGTTAVGEAYRAVKHGYAKAVICGGSEAAITPFAVAGFGACQTLSNAANPEEGSLPFDSRRGGFVMGEGAGALILEEYEHAKARGAKMYAEVIGYGSTCDAYHVTAPDPEAEASSRAIADAAAEIRDVAPDRIYYNAHGTGTQLNDVSETLALKKVFGQDAYKLHISSTKSMTGHMLGAAGAVEAIAAVHALNDGIVPPTINLKSPDAACDLDYTPETALKTPLDAAISASFGFGGHNACIAFRRMDE